MKPRERSAWLIVAAFLLIGAASVSRSSDVVKAIQEGSWAVTTVNSISNIFSGATPQSVISHINQSTFPLPVVAHITSINANNLPLPVNSHLNTVSANTLPLPVNAHLYSISANTLPIPTNAHVQSVGNIYAGTTILAVAAHKGGTSWTQDHISSVTHVSLVSGGSWMTAFSASFTAIGNSVGATTGMEDFSTGTVQISGTWVGGVQAQVTGDAGTTYFPVVLRNQETGVAVLTATANGAYTFALNAAQGVRLRAVDFTSGTIVTRGRFTRSAYGANPQHTAAATGAVCHSQTSFVSSAIEQIIVHSAYKTRIFICGITVLQTDSNYESVVLVEGTTAGCKTGTLGVWPGASAPHLGTILHSSAAASSIMRPNAWISTQTADNPLCFQKNGNARIQGTITYGAYPIN